MLDLKTKKKSERAIAGNASGKKTKPDGTGRGRSGGNWPERTLVERGEYQPLLLDNTAGFDKYFNANRCVFIFRHNDINYDQPYNVYSLYQNVFITKSHKPKSWTILIFRSLATL